MDRTAFCPGHITGFFEICRSNDILSTGSRGAGMCLTLGATSKVTLKRAPRQRIAVRIGNSGSPGEVTRAAIKHLLGEEILEVEVVTRLDLPMRQGFGMSAAGALSAALALADMLRMSRQRAFEAAHTAEVKSGSGLGDISAIHHGGIAIRRKAGLPPKGEVLGIDGAPELVLAVIGRGLRTKAVLGDPKRARAINSSGSRKVDELLEKPTLENLMRLSLEFTSETGLATRGVTNAIGVASQNGLASMSMLGSSIFAVGETSSLKRGLSGLGDVFVCRVDRTGPRIVESKP